MPRMMDALSILYKVVLLTIIPELLLGDLYEHIPVLRYHVFRGPMLNVTDTYMKVPTDSTLYIKCVGSEKLEWRFENPSTKEVKVLSTKDEMCGVRLHKAILGLELKNSNDSGVYRCSFEDTFSTKDSASVFLSVNDSLVSSNILTPTLNVSETTMDVPPNTKQDIKCTGFRPIVWHFQNPKTKSVVEIRSSEENHTDEFGRVIFESTAHLEFKTIRNTGRYICSHRETDPVSSASVYIFVNDPGQLLLARNAIPFQVIDITDEDPVLVPCLPTSSSVHVTFWKSSQNNWTYDNLALCDTEMLLTDGLSYDKTEGFKIDHPTTDYLGPFCCKAFLGEVQETAQFVFAVRRDEDCRFSSVECVKEEQEKIPVINSSFSLSCSHDIPTKGFFFGWSHPDELDTSRMSISSKDYQQPTDAFDERLTVHRAQRSDEGIYRCWLLSSITYDICWSEVFVQLYDRKEDSYYQENGMVAFRANYSSFPIYGYSRWMRNNVPINLSSRKYEVQYTSSAAELHIRSLSPNDNAVYTLQRRFSFRTEHEVSFHLRVKSRPKVVVYSRRTGNHIELLCKADGFPLPDTKWMWRPHCTDECDWSVRFEIVHEDGQYFPNALNTSKEVYESMNLVVLRMFLTDESPGQYFCKSTNEIGTAEERIAHHVGEHLTSYYKYHLVTRELDSLSLECIANKHLYNNLKMYTPGSPGSKEIPGSSGMTTEMKAAVSLKTTEMSNLKYECEVRSHNRSLPTNVKSVTVWTIHLDEPHIVKSNMNLTVMEKHLKDRLHLFCYVEDWDLVRAKVNWYRDNKPLVASDESNRLELSDNNQNLIITDLGRNDAGVYECRVKNKKYEVSRSVILDVITGPVIVSSNMESVWTERNVTEQLELFCNVDGNPFPTITWYYKSEPFSRNTSRVEFLSDSQRLVIKGLVKADSGPYECEAVNKLGVASQGTFVTVITDEERCAAGLSAAGLSAQVIISVAICVLSIAFHPLYRLFLRKRYDIFGKDKVADNPPQKDSTRRSTNLAPISIPSRR